MKIGCPGRGRAASAPDWGPSRSCPGTFASTPRRAGIGTCSRFQGASRCCSRSPWAGSNWRGRFTKNHSTLQGDNGGRENMLG